MFEHYKVIHFVGIGGIGMSGIAEVLRNLGYEVTGSDVKDSETIKMLRDLGIKVYIGHKKENIDGAHVLVVSSAIPWSNPELSEARNKSIPVIPRAEMLAELARLKYGILIAGTHGKTTTTSLISTILAHGGFDPTVVIGGRLRATGTNARLGQGEFLVAEADESDGSFLKLSPTIAVVTNVDREHMDFFKTLDSLKEAFLSFINKVPFYGASIICSENEELRNLLPFVHRRFITYGFSPHADIYAAQVKNSFMSVTFDVMYRDKNLGNVCLPLQGSHNILNCLASIAVGFELNIDFEVMRDGLKNFSGVQRRFELKGEEKGIKVFDDYGHHPTEIQATLQAAREGLMNDDSPQRLFVIFQPHRYTRTRDLMSEFSSCFSHADVLYLMDIYPAGEETIENVNSEELLRCIRETGHSDVVYISDREKLLEEILSKVKNGDICFTLGAGDVWKISDELLFRLRVRN